MADGRRRKPNQPGVLPSGSLDDQFLEPRQAKTVARERPVVETRRCPTCGHWLTSRDVRVAGWRKCGTCGATHRDTPGGGRKDDA